MPLAHPPLGSRSHILLKVQIVGHLPAGGAVILVQSVTSKHDTKLIKLHKVLLKEVLTKSIDTQLLFVYLNFGSSSK